ncbi:MAG: ATP-binding cassette, subfamily bacterial [Betaproteobacteria bacterium]
MNRTAHAIDSPGLLGLYRAFWHYAEGARLQVVASSTLLIGSQLSRLTIPWLTAQAINAIQVSGAGSARDAALLVVLILLATVVSWMMHGPGRIIERTVAVRVRQHLADRLYKRISELPLAWHEAHHSGETLHRIQKTTLALYDFAGSQFIYLQNLVNLIGPIAALMLLSTATGSLALAGFLVVGVVIVRFDKVLMTLVRTQNEAERRYSSALVDALGNISTVISLRLQSATRALLSSRLTSVFKPLRRNILINETKWCAVDLLTASLTWGLVAAYAWSSQQHGGALLLGNVFMVYQYANQATGVISSLAMHYQNFTRMQIDYASADTIWDAADRPLPQHDVPESWRNIEVEGLEFSHSRKRRDTPLLTGVSLTLERGKTVALVGPSGSGKSTLMRVLAGLYDADRARFTVDSTPLVGLRSLGPLSTLVPQDAEAFEGTILDNITFGADYSADAIAAALRISGFDSVVASLPQGVETLINERGLNLSGGQKQRMALARGILAAQASSLLLLDEPTSSLDPVTEARIFADLKQAVPDACIVAAVHRLNLLSRFDQVVLMEAGRVIDAGNVADLLDRQPLFRELWQRSTSADSGVRAA